MRPFIRNRVCNGVGTFLWHDFWNPLGPFLPLFGERILYDSAIHKNACVASVMDVLGRIGLLLSQLIS